MRQTRLFLFLYAQRAERVRAGPPRSARASIELLNGPQGSVGVMRESILHDRMSNGVDAALPPEALVSRCEHHYGFLERWLRVATHKHTRAAARAKWTPAQSFDPIDLG